MAKKGLIYALLSALLFSTMNVFVKLLGTNIPPGEIAFARGFFGTVAVLIIMYVKGIRFSKENRGSSSCVAYTAVLVWYVIS